jgi:hypothetical protein
MHTLDPSPTFWFSSCTPMRDASALERTFPGSALILLE